MSRGKYSFVLIALLCTVMSSSVDVVVGFTINQRSIANPITIRRRTSTTTTSLAARKKKKPKKTSAQTSKGFGAPPPKLDEILSTLKTRVPKTLDLPCPCGLKPGQTYSECCGPLHSGERACLTMSDVLMSRYVAFAWRNIKYVMDTTHPTCRDYREDAVAWARDLNKGGMFDSFEFVNLEAGEEEMSMDDANEGFLNFKVTLRAKEDRNGSAAGQEMIISERSRFLRNPKDGSWSYASGDVRSDVAGLEDAKLNA